MKINGYWVATETEATDANGAHVSPRDWRHQESGMTLKLKRKKNLKKKGRGGEMRTGGWESVSELKERREKGGGERKRRGGRRQKRTLREVGGMDA